MPPASRRCEWWSLTRRTRRLVAEDPVKTGFQAAIFFGSGEDVRVLAIRGGPEKSRFHSRDRPAGLAGRSVPPIPIHQPRAQFSFHQLLPLVWLFAKY